ncbi:hypothetical protein BH11BAC2_BH11BAC2_05280 [soil metagenome]
MKDGYHILKSVLIPVFCLFFSGTIAQQIRERWSFGNHASLQFDQRSSPLSSPNNMRSIFGTSTISDCSGNLLYYSNGDTIFDDAQQMIQNGDLSVLGIANSSECIFIPFPGYPLHCFLFYLQEKADSIQLKYALIDRTSGIAIVTSKNNLLQKNRCNKLTATLQQNGSDFWLLTHEYNSNEFSAFRITQNGVDTVPVNSNCGASHSGAFAKDGQMRFSLTGKKISLTVPVLDLIETFNFDKQSGIVTLNQQYSNCGIYYPFGITFSQDEKFLYVSTNLLPRLYQLDLYDSLGTGNCNLVVLDSLYSGTFGQLQYGPDGAIYVAVAVSSYIGKIQNPSSKGTSCGFNRNAVFLDGASCYNGLPNFVQSNFDKVYEFSAQEICEGEVATFYVDVLPELPLNVTWHTGDNFSQTQPLSHLFYHHYNQAGTYPVEMIVHYPCYNDTLFDSILVKSVPLIDLGTDTAICNNDTIVLSAGGPYDSYLWSTGETTSSISATSNHQYTVQVNENGCSSTADLRIDGLEVPTPAINFSGDLCGILEQFPLLTASPAAHYYWLPIKDTNEVVQIHKLGNYELIVTDVNSCSAKMSFSIVEKCPVLMYVPSAFSPDDDGLNDVLRISAFDYQSFSFKIFNRFGALIFDTNTPEKYWDGRDASAGIYRYIARIVNGSNISITQQGTITLLR